jgi:hypothetical protein
MIKIFLNDKQLSQFLYYYGYQTYYFNYSSTPNFGIYGEPLANLEWGDYETDTLLEDYKGIHEHTRDSYMLIIPNDSVVADIEETDFYKYDVNIYSTKLTLNETMWIFNHYASHDANIFKDIDECDHNTGVGGTGVSIANFEIHPEKTYQSIYDYDKEEFATIWNLFNRGFVKVNIFKIISIYCSNAGIDNITQQYYTMIGGIGRSPIHTEYTKLFYKTCFNVIQYFNTKIKKASNDSIALSYLYAIYADDDVGIYFNDEHEEQENRAYDILHDNGLLATKHDDNNIIDILDLLYEMYLQ